MHRAPQGQPRRDAAVIPRRTGSRAAGSATRLRERRLRQPGPTRNCNGYAYADTDTNADTNAYTDTNCHGYTDTNCHGYTDAKAYSNPDAHPSPGFLRVWRDRQLRQLLMPT